MATNFQLGAAAEDRRRSGGGADRHPDHRRGVRLRRRGGVGDRCGGANQRGEAWCDGSRTAREDGVRMARLTVVTATGIFGGVRKAGLARAVGGSLELSLDSWEAPMVFDVTAVDRDARGATAYRGAAPRAAGSREVIAIQVEADTPASGDALGKVRHVAVTRSAEGSPPDSVLKLAATPRYRCGGA